MTSRNYFGKQNSTLGSVVPLAMFLNYTSKFAKEIPFTVVKDMKRNNKGAGIL